MFGENVDQNYERSYNNLYWADNDSLESGVDFLRFAFSSAWVDSEFK